MVPLFDPGPIDHPDIPIHLAAVNPRMCAVAGEVADGIRPHPVCTPSYIEQVMLPAVRRGAARAGRSLDEFTVSMKPLVASAPDEEELEPKVRDARARIAFYAVDAGLRRRLRPPRPRRPRRRGEACCPRRSGGRSCPQLINDDVLHRFAVIGTYDAIGARLLDRFRDVVTDCEFSIAVRDDEDRAALPTSRSDPGRRRRDRARRDRGRTGCGGRPCGALTRSGLLRREAEPLASRCPAPSATP